MEFKQIGSNAETERATFNLLQSPDGVALRPEQERIPFEQVKAYLDELGAIQADIEIALEHR